MAAGAGLRTLPISFSCQHTVYDTTSSFFTLNLTVQIDFCMILWSKVGFLLLIFAKIVANQYCTDTSVQPANRWARPNKPNGIILGYRIQWSSAGTVDYDCYKNSTAPVCQIITDLGVLYMYQYVRLPWRYRFLISDYFKNYFKAKFLWRDINFKTSIHVAYFYMWCVCVGGGGEWQNSDSS